MLLHGYIFNFVQNFFFLKTIGIYIIFSLQWLNTVRIKFVDKFKGMHVTNVTGGLLDGRIKRSRNNVKTTISDIKRSARDYICNDNYVIIVEMKIVGTTL